jgi:hypothetical protein
MKVKHTYANTDHKNTGLSIFTTNRSRSQQTEYYQIFFSDKGSIHCEDIDNPQCINW